MAYRRAHRKPASAFDRWAASVASPPTLDHAPASRLGRGRALWLLSAACGVAVLALPLVGWPDLALPSLAAGAALALVARATR